MSEKPMIEGGRRSPRDRLDGHQREEPLPTPWETRLGWAARSWEAEVENARRLATRVNVVLTVALAFAGAGAKILGDALTDHPIELWSIGLLGGAAGGVVCIFVAFVRVLTKRQRQQRPPSASAHLLPPRGSR
jgi:hypothetical protein